MRIFAKMFVLYLLAIEDLFFLSVPVGYLVAAALIFNKIWVLPVLLLPDNEYLNPADLLVILLLLENLDRSILGFLLTLLFSLGHREKKIPLIFYLVCGFLPILIF
jgi:hypothetical protein